MVPPLEVQGTLGPRGSLVRHNLVLKQERNHQAAVRYWGQCFNAPPPLVKWDSKAK